MNSILCVVTKNWLFLHGNGCSVRYQHRTLPNIFCLAVKWVKTWRFFAVISVIPLAFLCCFFIFVCPKWTIRASAAGLELVYDLFSAFISHSVSHEFLLFVFKYALPGLHNKTIVDVGSRFGPILYAVSYFGLRLVVLKCFVAAEPFHCTQKRCEPLGFVNLFSIIGKVDLVAYECMHLNRPGKKQITGFSLFAANCRHQNQAKKVSRLATWTFRLQLLCD